MRQNGAGMYLMDEHFSTVSTRTSSSGWAVKFKILEGTMKTKGTMRLKVVQVYEGSEPMTIGSGYMVLTADESNRICIISLKNSASAMRFFWRLPVMTMRRWKTLSGVRERAM